MKKDTRHHISPSSTSLSAFACILAGFLLLSIPAFISCRKHNINGALDGNWQVMQIDWKDGTAQKVDYQAYYAFQLHVCELWGRSTCHANMTYDGTVITLDFPYVKSPYTALQPYGLKSAQTVLRVTKLTSSSLTMESDDAVIICRKF